MGPDFFASNAFMTIPFRTAVASAKLKVSHRELSFA